MKEALMVKTDNILHKDNDLDLGLKRSTRKTKKKTDDLYVSGADYSESYVADVSDNEGTSKKRKKGTSINDIRKAIRDYKILF